MLVFSYDEQMVFLSKYQYIDFVSSGLGYVIRFWVDNNPDNCIKVYVRDEDVEKFKNNFESEFRKHVINLSEKKVKYV